MKKRQSSSDQSHCSRVEMIAFLEKVKKPFHAVIRISTLERSISRK